MACGFVADGVEAELEACLGAFDGHFVELVLRVLRQAGVAGSSAKGAFIAAVREPSEPSMKPLSMPVWSRGSLTSWWAR